MVKQQKMIVYFLIAKQEYLSFQHTYVGTIQRQRNSNFIFVFNIYFLSSVQFLFGPVSLIHSISLGISPHVCLYCSRSSLHQSTCVFVLQQIVLESPISSICLELFQFILCLLLVCFAYLFDGGLFTNNKCYNK